MLQDFNPKRFAILAAVAVALLAWGVWQYRRSEEREQWRVELDGANTRTLLALSPDLVPANVAYLKRVAALRSERLIPPDHRSAERLIARAIAMEPLRSDLWVRIARHFIFTGQPEKARAALRRSDELDPSFPSQRLEAVQYWALLNDRDRAIELARSIARLDPQGTDEATRALLRIAVPADEIFDIVNAAALTPARAAAILPEMRSGDMQVMRRLYQKLPANFLNDRAFRQAIAPFFAQPVMLAECQSLWNLERPGLQSVPLALDGPLLVDNPELAISPFTNDFFFGWQALPASSAWSAFWNAPEGAANDVDDRLRITFDDVVVTSDKKLDWEFYRLPLPPSKVPIIAEVTIRADPPESSQCRMLLRLDGITVGGERSDVSRAGWQQLTTIIPPSDSARLCELVLERNRRPGMLNHTSRVSIRRIAFQGGESPMPRENREP